MYAGVGTAAAPMLDVRVAKGSVLNSLNGWTAMVENEKGDGRRGFVGYD